MKFKLNKKIVLDLDEAKKLKGGRNTLTAPQTDGSVCTQSLVVSCDLEPHSMDATECVTQSCSSQCSWC